MPVKNPRSRPALAALVVVAAAVPAFAACIFDSGGDYQGGGHRSEIPTSDTTASAVELVPTVVPTTLPVNDSGSSSIRDAGSDG